MSDRQAAVHQVRPEMLDVGGAEAVETHLADGSIDVPLVGPVPRQRQGPNGSQLVFSGDPLCQVHGERRMACRGRDSSISILLKLPDLLATAD